MCSLFSWVCIVCTKFCNACKENVSDQVCDMGPLRRLKLPPTGVITNGTDDIAKWTVHDAFLFFSHFHNEEKNDLYEVNDIL